MISITENEGNARLTAALPRVHIALVGIEKVLPRLSDLALFLPLLATAGAGQLMTGYNSFYGGPKEPGETDGPDEMHVVLLDNGRTNLLANPEMREALHCGRYAMCRARPTARRNDAGDDALFGSPGTRPAGERSVGPRAGLVRYPEPARARAPDVPRALAHTERGRSAEAGAIVSVSSGRSVATATVPFRPPPKRAPRPRTTTTCRPSGPPPPSDSRCSAPA